MPTDAQGKANGMAIAQNRPGTMQASVGLVETLAPFAFGKAMLRDQSNSKNQVEAMES
jgi:hypothetical protein